MFEDDALSETNLLFHVVFDIELELVLLAFCSGSEDEDVGGIFVPFVLDQCLLQLVIQLKVTCRKNLEDCVPVVFEVQNIVTGFVLYFDVCEALGGQKSLVLSISFEAFD